MEVDETETSAATAASVAVVESTENVAVSFEGEKIKEEPPIEPETTQLKDAENANTTQPMEIETKSEETKAETDSTSKSNAEETVVAAQQSHVKKEYDNNDKNEPIQRLFANIRYFILNTKNPEVERLLESNGAYKESYLGSLITHVICDDINENSDDYSEAKEVFELTIVKSNWVLTCIKTNSLLPTEAFSLDQLLNNRTFVNINVPLDIAVKLNALVTYYGGTTTTTIDSSPTVVLTHALSCVYDADTQAFAKRHPHVRLITPDWIVESIKASKCLDEYEFSPRWLKTNPEIVDIIKDMKTDMFTFTSSQDVSKSEIDQNEIASKLSSASEASKPQKIRLYVTPHLQQKDASASLAQETLTSTAISAPNPSGNVVLATAPTVPTKTSAAVSNSVIVPTTAATSVSNSQAYSVATSNADKAQQPQQLNLQQQPPRKRPRKQSSNNPSALDDDSSKSTTFSSDMNEIFQSVISAVSQNEDNNLQSQHNQQHQIQQQQPAHVQLHQTVQNQMMNATKTVPVVAAVANAVVAAVPKPAAALKKNPLPIQVDLVKKQRPDGGGNGNYFDQAAIDSSSTAEDNANLAMQENSHLISFDFCLLGCVFYLVPSDVYYTSTSSSNMTASECLSDWSEVIQRYGGRCVPDYDSYSALITHVLCPDRFSEVYKKAINDKKRTCTIFWLEDCLQEQKMRQPWLAYHFPSPYDIKNGPLKNHLISTHGFSGKDKLIVRTLIWLMGGKYTSYLSNINTYLICRMPTNEATATTSSKVEKAKKWNIPVVNAVWLSELYLGNAYALSRPIIDDRYKQLDVSNCFHYDLVLTREFMDQWRQLISLPVDAIRQAKFVVAAAAPLKQANSNNRRYLRPVSPEFVATAASSTTETKLSQIENSSNSTLETNGNGVSISWMRPQINIPCVMFTGIDQNEVLHFQKDVISLGGVVAKQPAQTTHLVVDKIERTAKLLKCISTCEYIVHIKWLVDSKSMGKFCDPNNYQVVDERFEKHYQCNLRESLARAKEKRTPLLSGLYFYLSPCVRPSHQDLSEMIRSAGGNVIFDAPRVQYFQEPFNDINKTGLTSKYVVVGSEKDIAILKPFIDRKIPIYNEELILSGLLKQKLDANSYKFYTTQ